MRISTLKNVLKLVNIIRLRSSEFIPIISANKTKDIDSNEE